MLQTKKEIKTYFVHEFHETWKKNYQEASYISNFPLMLVVFLSILSIIILITGTILSHLSLASLLFLPLPIYVGYSAGVIIGNDLNYNSKFNLFGILKGLKSFKEIFKTKKSLGNISVLNADLISANNIDQFKRLCQFAKTLQNREINDYIERIDIKVTKLSNVCHTSLDEHTKSYVDKLVTDLLDKRDKLLDQKTEINDKFGDLNKDIDKIDQFYSDQNMLVEIFQAEKLSSELDELIQSNKQFITGELVNLTTKCNALQDLRKETTNYIQAIEEIKQTT